VIASSRVPRAVRPFCVRQPLMSYYSTSSIVQDITFSIVSDEYHTNITFPGIYLNGAVRITTPVHPTEQDIFKKYSTYALLVCIKHLRLSLYSDFVFIVIITILNQGGRYPLQLCSCRSRRDLVLATNSRRLYPRRYERTPLSRIQHAIMYMFGVPDLGDRPKPAKHVK
jgi:hypothetical protein